MEQPLNPTIGDIYSDGDKGIVLFEAEHLLGLDATPAQRRADLCALLGLYVAEPA